MNFQKPQTLQGIALLKRIATTMLRVLLLGAGLRIQPQARIASATHDAATWVAEIGSQYYIAPNITYHVANNYEAKLDVYVARNASATAPVPTVISRRRLDGRR